jgi:hypothetical protein
MNRIYGILSVVGWIWCVIAAIFLAVKLCGKQKPPGSPQ